MNQIFALKKTWFDGNPICTLKLRLCYVYHTFLKWPALLLWCLKMYTWITYHPINIIVTMSRCCTNVKTYVCNICITVEKQLWNIMKSLKVSIRIKYSFCTWQIFANEVLYIWYVQIHIWNIYMQFYESQLYYHNITRNYVEIATKMSVEHVLPNAWSEIICILHKVYTYW